MFDPCPFAAVDDDVTDEFELIPYADGVGGVALALKCEMICAMESCCDIDNEMEYGGGGGGGGLGCVDEDD